MHTALTGGDAWYIVIVTVYYVALKLLNGLYNCSLCGNTAKTMVRWIYVYDYAINLRAVEKFVDYQICAIYFQNSYSFLLIMFVK